MVRFSDTLSMTGKVLKLNSSLLLYPPVALLAGVTLRTAGLHVSLMSGTVSETSSTLLTNAGFVIAATSITYAIFRIGLSVAKLLDRPTVVAWNPWIAAYGLAVPWIIAFSFYLMFGLVATVMLVIPGIFFFGLQWPYLVLVFGPRFNLETSRTLAQGIRKKSPFWLGSMGVALTLLAAVAWFLQSLTLAELGITLTGASGTATIGVKLLVDSGMAMVVYLACLHPITVALMLAEDLHETIFNAEYEEERRQKDLAELQDYFEDSVLPTLVVEPKPDTKIQDLRDLHARGAISDETFNREMDKLRSF